MTGASAQDMQLASQVRPLLGLLQLVPLLLMLLAWLAQISWGN